MKQLSFDFSSERRRQPVAIDLRASFDEMAPEHVRAIVAQAAAVAADVAKDMPKLRVRSV